MTAYYNEHDSFAAAWLRELIARNLIAPGDVDERSIADVQPDDLKNYEQCHFFAGIGVWSYALRSAGWAYDRKVWTGSCPCQPYSSAGKGEGAADARHLWPEWFRLIRECRPDIVFGEQVEAAIRHGWLDTVSADMEAEGYTIGSAVLGAHSVGAPHIRQRCYFVAESERGATERHGLFVAGATRETQGAIQERQRLRLDVGNGGVVDKLAHDGRQRRQQVSADVGGSDSGSGATRLEQRPEHSGDGVRGVEYADGGNASAEWQQRRRQQRQFAENGCVGFWDNCDWLPCRDGKWRPVEPGTFPLAHGAPVRVGRLRGYGNAIVAQQAQAFIEAYREVSEAAAP